MFKSTDSRIDFLKAALKDFETAFKPFTHTSKEQIPGCLISPYLLCICFSSTASADPAGLTGSFIESDVQAPSVFILLTRSFK